MQGKAGVRAAIFFALTAGAWAGAASGQAERPHFHHVHLNVVEPTESVEYYQRFFGAVPIEYRGLADALLTDRSFILLTQVSSPPAWQPRSGINHIGWGGVDGPSDFAWRDRLGMEWETPLTPLGPEHYMYAYGPSREIVEVWTGFHHHRFGHVHLFSDDVAAAHRFYTELLGLDGPAQVPPKPPRAPDAITKQLERVRAGELEASEVGAQVFRYLWATAVATPNDVTINIFAKPSTESINWWSYEPLEELLPTDGRAIDHIAFSYRNIVPVWERLDAAGVEVVKGLEVREEYGFKSFFVRGPDKVLVEIVEARPLPDGVWE